MIKNFDRGLIKPASIGLRLESLYRTSSKNVIDLNSDFSIEKEEIKLPHTIKPGEYLIGKSKEVFEVPNNCCLLHVHNSSSMRSGLQIIGGYIDPGYKGELFFGIKNIGNHEISLQQDVSLSKIIVLPVEGKTIPLITRFMGGKLI